MTNLIWPDGDCIRLSAMTSILPFNEVLHICNQHARIKITSLRIDGTSITSQIYDFMNAIIAYYGMSWVFISKCVLGNPTKLMSVVNNNLTLRGLYIDRSGYIDNRDCMCIASGLSNNTSLTSLHLDNNVITNDGFRCIMEAMTVNTSIRELYINCHTSDSTTASHLIETIPHIKSIRKLWLNTRYIGIANEVCAALEKNYSIEQFNTCGFGSEYVARIRGICERNKCVRIAHRELLDIAFAFAPMIRKYGCFDAYCMMWIFDYVNVANIHVSEFKKISVIKSVFELYRKKIRNESSSAAVLHP